MAWSSAELQDLVVSLREHGGDTTEIEVKLGAGGCPGLGPTLSAFGNMPNGGTIIVGLDEATDFSAQGVREPALMESGIAHQARNAVTPPVQVSFEEADVDGVVLVIATVYPLPSNLRPCRHQGQAYLRQADGDYVMSEQEVQQVIAARERPRYDASPVGETSKVDLDPDLLSGFLQQARAGSRRLANEPDLEVLQRRGVVAPDGRRLTVAGLYALGKYPQEFMPSLAITAAVQLDPRSGERTRDLVHLDGPLPALLDAAMEWVSRNTRTTIRFDFDGHGRDVAEIPMVAVRELIANALVHRDLGPHTQGKRVEIRLKNEVLVITNPGGLYGVSRQQLGSPGGKSAVNEFLYDICKSVRGEGGVRVIEGEGGGIREVQRVLRAANMRQPTFIDAGVRFTVLVPRHTFLSPEDLGWLSRRDPSGELSDVQRNVLVAMRHGHEWTNSRVRHEFAPIDSRQATALLQDLVSKGLAEARGERGQTSYGALPADRLMEGETSPRVTVKPPRGNDEVSEAQEALIDGSDHLASVSVNAGVVWRELGDSPRKASELVARTGLTLRQVRYALARLADAGHVDSTGGQGMRNTTYRRKAGSQVS